MPATVFVVCWTLTTHGKYSVSGDEPHYLIVSQSLLADGDLDLRNNHESGQSSRFGVENLQPGPHVRETRDGRMFPVHDVGVPVALLPVYFAATRLSQVASEPALRRFRMNQGLFAYSIISLFMIGMTTVAAVLTREALIADGSEPSLASAVVLATWLSPPVLSHSFLVFPEAFALVVTAWGVRVAAGSGDVPSRFILLAVPLSLGLLPWFHRKYAIYAAAVFVAVAWHQRRTLASVPMTQRAAALALFVVPQIALLLWTWYYWGSVGGPLVLERAPFSWDALRVGWLGLLVDRENGLLVWAPIYLFLPLAWALDWRRNWIWLLPSVSLFVISAAHDQWWGGFSPAARFLVPLVPVFAFAGVVLLRDRLLRRLSLALLAPQVVISAIGWQHPRWLWPQGDGHNRVLGAVLAWFGGSENVLPSLRTAVAATTRAGIVLVLVVASNAAAWLLTMMRRSRVP